jgi:hypothetical protein
MIRWYVGVATRNGKLRKALFPKSVSVMLTFVESDLTTTPWYAGVATGRDERQVKLHHQRVLFLKSMHVVHTVVEFDLTIRRCVGVLTPIRELHLRLTIITTESVGVMMGIIILAVDLKPTIRWSVLVLKIYLLLKVSGPQTVHAVVRILVQ